MTERHVVSILGRSAQTVDADGNKHWHEIGERTLWSDGSVTFTGDARQFDMPGGDLLRELGHFEPAAASKGLQQWPVLAAVGGAVAVLALWWRW